MRALLYRVVFEDPDTHSSKEANVLQRKSGKHFYFKLFNPHRNDLIGSMIMISLAMTDCKGVFIIFTV